MAKQEKAPVRGRRWTLLRRVSLWFVALVIGGFFLSNLVLMTPWGKGIITERLHQKTNLDWQIEGVSWSPWNGASASGVKAFHPSRADEASPLLTVEEIQVKPYWSQLLRGKIRPREVHVTSPTAEVSLEVLSDLLSSVQRPPRSAATSSQVAAPVPVRPLTGPSSPHEANPKPPKETHSEPQPPTRSNNKDTAGNKPPASEAKASALPVRLQISNASFRIFSESKDADLFSLEGVSIDMPLLGAESSATLEIETIRLPGIEQISDVHIPLNWRAPYLELDEQETEIGGIKFRYVAQLAVIPDLPFLFDVVLDPQKVERCDLLEGAGIVVSAENAKARLRGSGALKHPASWRGDTYLIATNAAVSELHGGNKIVFDRVLCPAVFRQGELSWDSVSAISEDVSILGNGRVSMGDGIISVTRLVASPPVSDAILRGLHGMPGFHPGYHWWKNLDTPDRKFRDLLVIGPLLDPRVSAGDKGRWLPLWGFSSNAIRFIRSELKEEGLVLKKIPNQKMLEHHAHH